MRMPVSRSTCAMKSPPLSASRVALVAAAMISSTLCDSARRLNLARVCSAAVIAVGVRLRPSRPPAPSRTMSFSRSITSNDRSGRTCTTIMWMELVPMSMAAMRIQGTGRTQLAKTWVVTPPLYTGCRSTVRESPASWAKSYHEPCRVRVTRLMLERRARELKRHLPAAIEGDGIGVHQARVASRRLREAVPVLAEDIKGNKAGKAHGKVRRLTRALGAVRELDVTLSVLDELAARDTLPRDALEDVRAHVVEERESRRATMLKRLAQGQGREAGLAAGVGRRGAAGCRDRTLARDVVRAAGQTRQRRSRRRSPTAGQMYNPERLHQVRIATKKLRYGLEIAAESGIRSAAAPVRQLKRAQDTLGRLHDLQVLELHVAAVQAQPPARELPDGSLRDGGRRPRGRVPAPARPLHRRCRPRCWPRCTASARSSPTWCAPARRRGLKMALPAQAASADRGRSGACPRPSPPAADTDRMPTFELYLIRHGVAAERGDEYPDDSKRPLTPQGIVAAAQGGPVRSTRWACRSTRSSPARWCGRGRRPMSSPSHLKPKPAVVDLGRAGAGRDARRRDAGAGEARQEGQRGAGRPRAEPGRAGGAPDRRQAGRSSSRRAASAASTSRRCRPRAPVTLRWFLTPADAAQAELSAGTRGPIN